MPSLRERTVLESIIRNYIETGEPVSSKRIAKELGDLDSSPATIRNVMADLAEAGYIKQPHTSAGRVPTQKGYRFFVDTCMRTTPLTEELEMEFREVEDWAACLRLITRQTHLYTIAALEDDSSHFNFGMGEMLGNPEFENPELVHSFGRLVDRLFEDMDDYRNALTDDTPRVFIEEENPIPEARFVSIVAAPVDRKSIILAIGPSRMDYEAAISVLYNLSSIKIHF